MCCSASINKLLASIRHILEVFPENVIIRALADNNEPSIEFANQSAVSTFDISERSDNSRFRNTQRFAVLEQSDQNLNELTMDMDDVLDYLERKHVDINNEDVQLQMVDRQIHDDESNFEGSKFFTVKTIEVEWEQHQHALMHVFVNVSSVKKLEKVKTTNKWLHIMFSSISHEFRTPLNAFMNALTLIKINFEAVEAALDDKTAALTSVVKSRDSLHRNITTASVSSKVRKFVADCVVASLTEDILDFAKIEAGMFALNEKPLEVASLVAEVEFIFENQCRQKGLWLKIHCPAALMRTRFDSDADRIRQVLMNLVSNAHKFTNSGGITVAFELVELRRDRLLKVTVTDTDVGISEAESRGLFQVFGMVHKHRDQFNMKGTGLGLTISQKLVKMLGGSITMQSLPGFGTTMTFTVREKWSAFRFEEVKCDINNSQYL